ncbi:hypothetical protein [Terrabacter carboxydivorans]|uniref:hypothetical protein n=1 Tax=Terrabacter carboxydivorans TaxID=619730 RepID=UPI0031D1F0D0
MPDPQQDRHVAFPDDADSGCATSAGTSLPPEAWAPRTPRASSTRSSAGIPVHTILATPPLRPERRRRGRGWAALLFVPILLFGVAHNGGGAESGTVTGECWYGTGVDQQTSPCDPGPSFAGTVEDVTSSAGHLTPLLRDTPPVARVPADATALRVEVVATPDAAGPRGDSSDILKAQIDVSAGGVPIDAREQEPPLALDIGLVDRPTDLQVSASITWGSGTIQCRVYASDTLVAVATSTATATCIPAL